MVALRLPAPAPADQRQLGGRPSFANRHPGLVALAFLGVLGLAFLVGAWLRGLGVPRVAAYAVAFALPWVA
ncbi:MAG TPA: hypothetical protein PLM38_11450, partial [Ottowia sp.]|nr:hypothetical protein [Ottowia sp.]